MAENEQNPRIHSLRVNDANLGFAITSLVSVFRNGEAVELAGQPWTGEERLADRFGTANQLAWKAATLVAGRLRPAAAVNTLIPCVTRFLRHERNSLGVVQATYWAGELNWSWIGKEDARWQAVLRLAGNSDSVADSAPDQLTDSGGVYILAVCSGDIPARGLANYYIRQRRQLGWRIFSVDRSKDDPFNFLHSAPPPCGRNGLAQPAASA